MAEDLLAEAKDRQFEDEPKIMKKGRSKVKLHPELSAEPSGLGVATDTDKQLAEVESKIKRKLSAELQSSDYVRLAPACY